jgi:hypothetical protein
VLFKSTGQTQMSLYELLMRPERLGYAPRGLTSLAAPALETAEGSLRRSRVAHHLLYGIVLIYSGMSLVGGSLGITLQARHCPALHRRGFFIRSRNPCQA